MSTPHPSYGPSGPRMFGLRRYPAGPSTKRLDTVRLARELQRIHRDYRFDCTIERGSAVVWLCGPNFLSPKVQAELDAKAIAAVEAQAARLGVKL